MARDLSHSPGSCWDSGLRPLIKIVGDNILFGSFLGTVLNGFMRWIGRMGQPMKSKIPSGAGDRPAIINAIEDELYWGFELYRQAINKYEKVIEEFPELNDWHPEQGCSSRGLGLLIRSRDRHRAREFVEHADLLRSVEYALTACRSLQKDAVYACRQATLDQS